MGVGGLGLPAARPFSGEGIELVCITKQGEAIDSGWFPQPTVDLLVVLQGQLRVEFADPQVAPQTLQPGDLLVLPPVTRCRAYHWPLDAAQATVLVAVYPTSAAQTGSASPGA